MKNPISKDQYMRQNNYILLRNICTILCLPLIIGCVKLTDWFGGVPAHYWGTGIGLFVLAVVIQWYGERVYRKYAEGPDPNVR